MIDKLCPPAILYLGFSLTQIVIDTFKGFYNTAFFKTIVMIIFTLLLNILCKQGLSIISWLIVFIPFILMSVIVTMLLFVFKLDPKTGKVRRVDPKQERGNRDVILYHDHGHGEHGEHDNYKHGKGVEMGSYSAAQPIDIKRNYRFEYETEAGKNVDMNHVRDQRLSNY